MKKEEEDDDDDLDLFDSDEEEVSLTLLRRVVAGNSSLGCVMSFFHHLSADVVMDFFYT